MLRRTTLIATALIPAAASAAPAPTVAEQDGQRFEYSTHLDGDKVILDGRFLGSSQKFTFTVLANGRVHGVVGGTPVEFGITHKDHDRLMSEIAAEQQPRGSELATIGN